MEQRDDEGAQRVADGGVGERGGLRLADLSEELEEQRALGACGGRARVERVADELEGVGGVGLRGGEGEEEAEDVLALGGVGEVAAWQHFLAEAADRGLARAAAEVGAEECDGERGDDELLKL